MQNKKGEIRDYDPYTGIDIFDFQDYLEASLNMFVMNLMKLKRDDLLKEKTPGHWVILFNKWLEEE